VLCGVFLGRADDLVELCVGQRLLVSRLLFLQSAILVVSLPVVALFLGHLIVRVGLLLCDLGSIAVLAGVAVFELGLRDAFLALGLLDADVLLVARELVARRLVGLVVGADLVLLGR